MTRDQLLEKSLGDLREIAKLQGVKSITKYRKGELVDIIMNGGSKLSAVKPKAEAEEKAGAVSAPSAPQRTEEAPSANAASGVMPRSIAPASSPATVRRMLCFAFLIETLLFLPPCRKAQSPRCGCDTMLYSSLHDSCNFTRFN